VLPPPHDTMKFRILLTLRCGLNDLWHVDPIVIRETGGFVGRLSLRCACPVYSRITPMSARHSHRWLAWLLPLFLLRAFIPVGFMLSWSAEGLQIVMCSGIGPLPMPTDTPTVDAQQHHSDSHAGGGQHEHSWADNAAMCPFGFP